MKKILITGASGLIGSFIVEEALRRGMETRAIVRRTFSREYLRDERIHFIELDFSSADRLEEQLSGYQFDYVVYAAGVAKCLNKEDLLHANRDGTRNFVEALQTLNQPLERFVFLSSPSIFGTTREQQPYKEIEPTGTLQPDAAYGKSRLEAEQLLPSSFPYIILRPTGVYGPHEKDYFLMVRSVKEYSDFVVGYKRQDIILVYVKDVVQATFLILGHGRIDSAYSLSDGKVYRSTTFGDLTHEELDHPWWTRITAPVWVLRVATLFGDFIGHVTGKILASNNDRYRTLKQRNWRCNIHPAIEELDYKPEYNLRRGVKGTIEWYKKEGWL